MSEKPLVQAGFGAPERQNRWTVAFRYVLVFPHAVKLFFYSFVAAVVIFVGWFAALFMGRLPKRFARFLSNFFIYQTRVYSYTFLMNDKYPPFSTRASYDVNLDISQSKVRRLSVLFRIFLIIPANLLSSLVGFGLSLCSVFIWLIVLVNGSMPISLFGAIAAELRFQARANAYMAMITAKYPGELFGDKPTPEIDSVSTSDASLPHDQLGDDRSSLGTSDAEAPDGAPTSEGGFEYPDFKSDASPLRLPPPLTETPNESLGDGPLDVPSAPPLTARLILHKGSKRILVVFLILGALGYAAYGILDAKIASNRSPSTSLQDAYVSLVAQINTAKNQSTACSLSKDACSKKYFDQVAGDFKTFEIEISRISYPTSDQSDAQLLEKASNRFVALLYTIGNSSGGVTRAQLNEIQTRGSTFDARYTQLSSDLDFEI